MDSHQQKLMEAAARLGIETEDMSDLWRINAVKYRYQGREELIIDGRIYSSLGHQQDILIDDKHVTKMILKELGIPVPDSCVFVVEEDESLAPEDEIESQIEGFFKKDQLYVCKPLLGTEGDAVGMHLGSMWAIEEHVNANREAYATWLLEEQIEGQDLRIQAICGKLVAACVRKPAFVTGDGVRELDDLIAAHNEKIAGQNPQNKLEIDGAARQLMRQQEVYLSSVIEEGRRIVLKQVSNMGQGGVAEDVTDVLHPRYREWIEQIAERFRIRTFAFDCISNDPSADPLENSATLELNAKAQWMHHTFSDVRQHDIPTLILKDLFSID